MATGIEQKQTSYEIRDIINPYAGGHKLPTIFINSEMISGTNTFDECSIRKWLSLTLTANEIDQVWAHYQGAGPQFIKTTQVEKWVGPNMSDWSDERKQRYKACINRIIDALEG